MPRAIIYRTWHCVYFPNDQGGKIWILKPINLQNSHEIPLKNSHHILTHYHMHVL